jgi:hypothetical protein
MLPARAGRTAPVGNAADDATSVSLTCVPFGEKFGAGLPSPGARYSSGTLISLDCAVTGARLATTTKQTVGQRKVVPNF